MNNKRKGVLSRVFNISSERKGLLIISVFASVIGMVSGVVPYLSVYFIGKHYLVNGLSDTNEIIFWVIVSAGAIVCNTVFTFLGSLGCHTVRGNIIMNRNVSDEEMIEASKKARCHEFIMKLSEGYNTKIGSGSIKLSGGEAQRLSIARAILKDSPIIVLDEALAYSDAENENLIQMAIKNLIEDKTIIIIAHRLQSIMTADQVLVLRQGEIIEQGNHSSLLGKDAEYKMLWELQHKTDDWSITVSKKEGQHERNH